MAGAEFVDRLTYYANAWLPARDVVKAAFEARQQIHPSGKVVRFDDFAPWKEHLYDLEAELGIEQDDKPLFVLYPETNKINWRIQAIPIASSGFVNRKSLPAAWCGLRDDALAAVSGIPDIIFCHAAGFTGGLSPPWLSPGLTDQNRLQELRGRAEDGREGSRRRISESLYRVNAIHDHSN